MNYNLGFQYLIVLSFLGFIHFVLINNLIGFQPKNDAPYKFKLLIYMMWLLPFVQFFVCGARVFYTLSGDINIVGDPLTAYISYFISPVGTLIIVWFLRNHFIETRKYCQLNADETLRIDTSLNMIIFLFFICGILVSALSDLFFGLKDKMYTMILFGYLTLCFNMIEISFNRIFLKRISCISYSWFWFFGTYIYILTKI